MRRGMIRLGVEDIHRLFKLGPNERVTGVMADWPSDSILIRIDGDEGSDLPECAEGTYPMVIKRPLAMVELRSRLLVLIGELKAGGADPAEFVADLERVLREELLP